VYLKALTIQNFRSFEEITIPFCEDLTVLVGENNGGKSNAIDAIRLLTKPLGGRRDLYCESTDVRFGGGGRKFELAARFEGLSPAQRGRFLSAAADHLLTSCVFGLRYDETTRFPPRPVIWAGTQQNPPEPGCHEMVRHVYLPPLRDAKRELASGHPTRIHALLNHFLDGGDPDTLARSLKRSGDADILDRIGNAVETGLSALTLGVRRQSAALGFADDERLVDIARELRFKLADHGIKPEDLRYSGHGYANLLYMATIAVELERVNDADLTLFLVEEPEAHLHPQLQAAVLSFLDEQAGRSKQSSIDHEGPAGQLQIVVATHSPNLSAWVESKKLVFFRSLAPGITQQGGAEDSTLGSSTAMPSSLPRRATHCIPLAELALTDAERRKVDRYLDVTRSALLFGGRVLLVEGIAEALLLPIIAKKVVFNKNVDKLRLFRSAVFVPIEGVDFEPYMKLLLTPFRGARIADRLVVLTDGDRGNAEPGELSPGLRRKASLEATANGLDATHVLRVVVNDYSLETELVRAGNAALLRTIYTALHPRSAQKWDAAVALAGDEQSLEIQKLFNTTRKGDFAQLLAEAIDAGAQFNVPRYLEDAIEALVA
jgi:putative ATP-dependent endonuclease of the OLD family